MKIREYIIQFPNFNKEVDSKTDKYQNGSKGLKNDDLE